MVMLFVTHAGACTLYALLKAVNGTALTCIPLEPAHPVDYHDKHETLQRNVTDLYTTLHNTWGVSRHMLGEKVQQNIPAQLETHTLSHTHTDRQRDTQMVRVIIKPVDTTLEEHVSDDTLPSLELACTLMSRAR